MPCCYLKGLMDVKTSAISDATEIHRHLDSAGTPKGPSAHGVLANSKGRSERFGGSHNPHTDWMSYLEDDSAHGQGRICKGCCEQFRLLIDAELAPFLACTSERRNIPGSQQWHHHPKSAILLADSLDRQILLAKQRTHFQRPGPGCGPHMTQVA